MSGLRYITPVRPLAARGLVRRVYREVRRELGAVVDPRTDRSPYLAHSPAPELLAALWVLQYEAMFVGGVPRAEKELLGAVISARNACPFCVEAHALFSQASGGEPLRGRAGGTALAGIADPSRRALMEWASASGPPDSVGSAPLRRGEAELAEILATALLFDYVNRVVLVFIGDQPLLPAHGLRRRLTRAVLLSGVRRASGRPRQRGRSLALLPAAALPHDLDWAGGAANVGDALARFSAAVERCAEPVLPPPVRTRLDEALADWDGSDPGLGSPWLSERLEGLDEEPRAVARVCLITALAPYRLAEGDVARFRAVRGTDRELVAAVGWAAFCAARRRSRGLWEAVGSRDGAVRAL
jgi:AhpD family alkylhydroperoxidase